MRADATKKIVWNRTGDKKYKGKYENIAIAIVEKVNDEWLLSAKRINALGFELKRSFRTLKDAKDFVKSNFNPKVRSWVSRRL